MDKIDVIEIYGSKVFNEQTMRQRLPKATFRALKSTIETGAELTLEVAEVVASAMKDWAIEQGVTHFTHWFHPMTGITAEKHDSFISPMPDGTVIMEFSGKELIKGEPDASSFPSGGLRATFEARGYTAWDPTSYAFIKDDTLCIPTAFCSYSGEALDKKTPLLRSVNAVSKQALRVLRLFGIEDAASVVPTVGAEQEYFLIDRELYKRREDLIFTGRTLFGAPPPKGQELDDHYFGIIKPRVAEFMKDLDRAMWELGIASRTKHNEVAPAQHENAQIFESCNLAADHNQLTMELMQKLAPKHGFACLLHEKPFEGVNGSGKHDNWSLSTSNGQNLLDPGSSPIENAQFLTFLAAIVSAVDDYADLLRLSVATAGNDHRLGANEAPPAVVSIFLGEELNDVIDALIEGRVVKDKKQQFDIGVSSLPKFPKDTTDRNRTSPFAFTGNKFEFRMVGSNLNIAGPNIIINTIVAESLSKIADELEKAEDFKSALNDLLINLFKKHKRIIFNGNGYDANWLLEAEKRNLPNFAASADALPHFADEKNIELFKKHKVFTEVEVHSRTEILLEAYIKAVNIEALTMIDITKREILPACIKYEKQICDTVIAKNAVNIKSQTETELANKLSELIFELSENNKILSELQSKASDISSIKERAEFFQNTVLPAMREVRNVADTLETLMPKISWPMPTYSDILYSIN